MKLISLIRFSTLSTLLLLSVSLYAEISENTKNRIDNACLRQAVSLVNQLKSEIYTDMDSTQSNKIVKLATSTCRTQFNQTNNQQAVAATTPAKTEKAEAATTEEESSDRSIFDILTEEPVRKPGNERLRKHKK
jgi:Na+-translocating ferredoxin:NAD+ oxidoreductase RnfG subunit